MWSRTALNGSGTIGSRNIVARYIGAVMAVSASAMFTLHPNQRKMSAIFYNVKFMATKQVGQDRSISL
jgi:hypothetical protein